MGLFSKNTKEEIFWSWFEKNEKRIFDFESDQEKIFDELSEKLDAYEEGLMFEFSPVKDGKREFAISAEGIKDLFSCVESLVGAVPGLEHFIVVAFRQRVKDYMGYGLTYKGKSFDPQHLWFYSRVEDGFFDLILYHLNFEENENDVFIDGAYLLLDSALGEYDVSMNIRYIDNQRLPDDYDEYDIRPYSELRGVFDQYLDERDHTEERA